MQKRRVVVTGLGCITPVGNNVDDFWSALNAGKSGVEPITVFDAKDMTVQFSAPIKNFDAEKNRFKVKAGLTRKEWLEKGWIFKEDPLGWFQWYCRFQNGRRIPRIDEIQIKRWKAFKRHVTAIKKNCEQGDIHCRRKQRQAILQWAYNPYI